MSKVKFCETHPRNLKDFGDVNAEKIVLTQSRSPWDNLVFLFLIERLLLYETVGRSLRSLAMTAIFLEMPILNPRQPERSGGQALRGSVWLYSICL